MRDQHLYCGCQSALICPDTKCNMIFLMSEAVYKSWVKLLSQWNYFSTVLCGLGRSSLWHWLWWHWVGMSLAKYMGHSLHLCGTFTVGLPKNLVFNLAVAPHVLRHPECWVPDICSLQLTSDVSSLVTLNTDGFIVGDLTLPLSHETKTECW